jgi:Spy/CpxP family protein refolding chaperone
MRKIVVAMLVAAASVGTPLAWAEDKAADVTDMQALRAAVKADKRAFVASMLKLTDAEAKRFWPIYDTYQRNLDMTSRQRVIAVEGLLFRDKPMTNLAAKNLVSEVIALDDAELKSRRTLRNRVMRALPPLKAARYLQLEEKIQAVRDYDIASTVPLIR